jgi:acetoin utilization deacetylase AcuC-like enzyme
LRRALEAIDVFNPSMIFVSLGLDTYRLDPIGDFAVTTDYTSRPGYWCARSDVRS